ncbi:hypothetical protein WJX82_010119 [Trebouxia sp. C0006]
MTLTASLPAFTDTLPSWQVVEVSQEDAGVQESRRAAAAAGRAARSTCRENLHPRQAHVTDAPAAPVATGTPLQDASNLPDLSHPQTAEVARKARRAQHKRDVRAAMSEHQVEAVRATNAHAHKKSSNVHSRKCSRLLSKPRTA